MAYSKKRRDALISRAFARACSGIQIPIMELGKIYKAAEHWLTLNPDGSEEQLAAALRSHVTQSAWFASSPQPQPGISGL